MTDRVPTIIEAINDPDLFGPWFKKPATWRRWAVLLKAAFCIPLDDPDDLPILKEHTDLDAAPAEPPREIWLKCGRRSGKTLIISTIAAYLSAYRDFGEHLVPGEDAVILIVAVDRRQARSAMRYLTAMYTRIPTLAALLAGPPIDDTITLRNGLALEIGTNSKRSIRGRTIVAALCDEIAHWRDEDHLANPDVEVIDGAIRPAMATIPNSLLLASSSPHRRRGIQWSTFKECFGRPSDTLCWTGRSLVMNPTLPPGIVDRAMQRDASRANAEFNCIEREDLEDFVSVAAVERCIATGRAELAPRPDVRYFGFVDCAGGSGGDSMTAAVTHLDGQRVIVDAVRERRPNFSPDDAASEFCSFFKTYRIFRARADRYAADWPVDRFKAGNVELIAAEQTKSELYLELAPEINAQGVELLDHPRTIEQLVGLEKRAGRSGRDSVDHAPGGHDDLINAVAGAVVEARRHARRAPPTFTLWSLPKGPGESVRGFDDGGRPPPADWIRRSRGG